MNQMLSLRRVLEVAVVPAVVPAGQFPLAAVVLAAVQPEVLQLPVQELLTPSGKVPGVSLPRVLAAAVVPVPAPVVWFHLVAVQLLPAMVVLLLLQAVILRQRTELQQEVMIQMRSLPRASVAAVVLALVVTTLGVVAREESFPLVVQLAVAAMLAASL
jgi:hypothetical protein